MQPLLRRLTSTGSGLAMLILAIVSLNIIAARLYLRVDVTEDRVFSLSEGSKAILEKLSQDVTIKYYFSRSSKELPPTIKVYASRVEEVLQEYAAYSKGRLNIEIIDPKPDTDDEEWAQKYNINPVQLPRGEQVYFGLVVIAQGREVSLPYLDPRREEYLEYELSEALVRVFRQGEVKLGIMSSLAVMNTAGHGSDSEGTWALASDLSRNFKLTPIAENVTAIPDDIQVLIVLHPKAFGEQAQYALDQFLMRGGRLIVALDPLSRADLRESQSVMHSQGRLPSASSNLDKLLPRWGINYNDKQLVGDQTLATQINAGGQVIAYPYFLTLTPAQLGKGSTITAGLKQLMLAEAGSFSLAKDSTLKLEPLLMTTKESGTHDAMMAGFIGPMELAKGLKSDGEQRVLAGLITGSFTSAFTARPSPPSGEATRAGDDANKPHLSTSAKGSALVLVTDVDFLADGNAADRFRFGNQTMIRPRNDNLAFIANTVELLSGSEDLIAIRSRGRLARPFTRVLALQKEAQARWQKQEERLTEELTTLQKKLSELQAQRTDGNRFVLSTQQEDEVRRFREQERAVKQRRREVRRNLREDIESLGLKLALANLLLVPVATSAFGTAVFVKRSRRSRTAKGRSHAP